MSPIDKKSHSIRIVRVWENGGQRIQSPRRIFLVALCDETKSIWTNDSGVQYKKGRVDFSRDFEGGKEENCTSLPLSPPSPSGFNTANGPMSMWKGISGYTTPGPAAGTYIHSLHPLGCGTITAMCQPLSPPHVSITFVTHYSSAWKAFGTTSARSIVALCRVCLHGFPSFLHSVTAPSSVQFSGLHIQPHKEAEYVEDYCWETVEIIGLNRLADATNRRQSHFNNALARVWNSGPVATIVL